LCTHKTLESVSLIDCVSVGVDRKQTNFEPMRKQVEAWQKSEVTDVTAKLLAEYQNRSVSFELLRMDGQKLYDQQGFPESAPR
jgi:hypothetical protein